MAKSRKNPNILGKLLCLRVCFCTVLRSFLKVLSTLTDSRKETKNAALANSGFSEHPSLKKPAFHLLKDYSFSLSLRKTFKMLKADLFHEV